MITHEVSTARPQVSCVAVVDAYGAVIERLSHNERQVQLTSELPYEKPLIEAALLELALRGGVVPEKNLKAGFIELATFQDNISGAAIDWRSPPPESRAGIAAWFARNGDAAAIQGQEVEEILRETQKRVAEWDRRLASMRVALRPKVASAADRASEAAALK